MIRIYLDTIKHYGGNCMDSIKAPRSDRRIRVAITNHRTRRSDLDLLVHETERGDIENET